MLDIPAGTSNGDPALINVLDAIFEDEALNVGLDGENLSTTAYAIYAQPPLSPSRLSKTKFSILFIPTSWAEPVNIWPQYVAKYGTPPEPDVQASQITIAVQSICKATGISNRPQTFSTIMLQS